MRTTSEILADMVAAVRVMEEKRDAYHRARDQWKLAEARVNALEREKEKAQWSTSLS